MTAPGLRRHRVRARLAIGLTVSTLLVAAAVAVAATVLATWQSNAADNEAEAGAARIGDDVAVVIVNDESGDAAAQARTDTLRWSLVALGFSVIPAIGVGWFAAGRMLGTVDEALAGIDAAEDERQRRLQEVVHELRTPLAVMSTNLELAASDPGLAGEAPGFVDAARRAVDRMDRTVDDMAANGRLEVAGDATPVDIAAVGTAVAAEHAGPARSRGVHLILAGRGPATIPGVDRAAVQTSLGNFVANAVRLAPQGSAVTIDWGIDSHWAWVAVRDEGPGLPPRHHARVFERGWRGRHERDRNGDGGAGLGLTIARQLTEAQGGVVTLESEEGLGSTFAVWLPLGPSADTAEAVAPDGIHPVTRPWRVSDPIGGDARA